MIGLSSLLKKVFNKHASCCAGRDVYNDILKKIDVKNTSLIIFPESDLTLNYYGLLYLDEYLLRKLKNGAFILTYDVTVAKAAKVFSNNIKDCEIREKKDIFSLISLYQMINFEMDVVIISLERPSGRKASNLIGARGLSVEQLVAIGIYFIIPYRKQFRKIVYGGDDSDILELLLEGYNE